MTTYRGCSNTGKRGRVFDYTPLRLKGMPSLIAALDNGELLIQPGHVGIFGDDTIDLLRLLDGTPGRAYVVIPDNGYQEMERIRAENTLLVSASWLKRINRGTHVEHLGSQIKAALSSYDSNTNSLDIRPVEGICGLVGVEGVSDVFSQH